MAIITPTRRTIPGPPALPLLGWRANMFKLFGDPFRYLRWLHDTYGDVVALAQGDPSWVCAFGPELNFRLLANPELFEVSAEPFQKVLLKDTAITRLGAHSLQMMKGEHHKQQRRLIQPALHKQQVVRYDNDMVALTQSMLDSWQGRSEIDLYREMKQLTRRIVVKLLFGLDDEVELDHISMLMERMGQALLVALIAPINMPGTPYHRALHTAERLEVALRSLIAHKRSEIEATDLLAVLIQAHDEDGTKLSDDELLSHTFTLFGAGHETTTNALTWTIFLLNQHPQSFSDLLDGTLHGNPPTGEQVQHLTLLDGVVKESLRLLPPAVFGRRNTTASCELGSFVLPKGAAVIYSEFVTHRLPELYEEPDRFKPERWAALRRTAYEYLPFSAGQHRCIGAEFAIQEIKMVLATLLQRYRLSVMPGARIATNLAMRPVHGVPMHVFPQDRRFQRVPVRGGIHNLIELA